MSTLDELAEQFLVGGAEQHVDTRRSLRRKRLSPYSVHLLVASYGSRGSSAGNRISWAPMASISSRTTCSTARNTPQAQRQPAVDARCGTTDIARTHEQFMAGHLGVSRVIAQRSQEQGRHACDHSQSA